ncbi:MAG: DoxX family protein [Bacteroidota bacterium]
MLNKLEQYYYEAKENKWYRYFAVFCRLTLAVAWVISGSVKILGERFAAGLSHNHPLGQYFDALLNTGYYYTFIGVGQVIVAILLLIPRTAIIGAISSFPIILNICVLTYSVRFEGTRAATFMLLANIFLLCWYYDRLKSILPFKQVKTDANLTKEKPLNHKFPFLFFGGVVATLAAVVFLNNIMYDIRPGNAPEECWNGCPGNSNPKACEAFCDCIHNKGKPLGKCLEEYEKVTESDKKDSLRTTIGK